MTDNAASMVTGYKFGLLGDEEADKYYDTNNIMLNGTQILDDNDEGKRYLFFYQVPIVDQLFKNKDIRSWPCY